MIAENTLMCAIFHVQPENVNPHPYPIPDSETLATPLAFVVVVIIIALFGVIHYIKMIKPEFE